MKTKKSLGQHFLKSEKALSQIVAAAQPTKKDVILEIGPGEGVLTERLLQTAGKVIAVEKDRDLIPILSKKFQSEINEGKLEIIEQDILNFDPELLRSYKGFTYKIVANIPYYITGAIIEKFLSAPYQPVSMVLLMQKEVAERIVARDKKESVLSIAVRAYGKPSIVAKVPRGAFVPAPKVDSAILYIENISRDFFIGINEEKFFSLIKTLFGKKRKQIGGSFTEYIGVKDTALAALAQSKIDSKTRPEDISIEIWKTLLLQIEK